MEHYKISKSLNDSAVSKFVIRKRIEVNNLPGDLHSVNKNITFKTLKLRSDLYDYSEALLQKVKLLLQALLMLRKEMKS